MKLQCFRAAQAWHGRCLHEVMSFTSDTTGDVYSTSNAWLQPLRSKPASDAATKTVEILLVEDNRFVRRAIARSMRQVSTLRTESGERVVFHVHEAEEGHGARTLLNGRPGISLVITDCHMPLMDGLDLLASIRSNEGYAQVPVVALTAGGAEILSEAEARGASAVLRKPSRQQDIVTVISRLLALSEVSAESGSMMWQMNVSEGA
jgi:CheY-like chemotaxis protein